MKYILTLVVFCFSTFLLADVSPEKVFVVANASDENSVGLAKFYCRSRNIPQKNIVVLDIPKNNGFVTQKIYLEKIETPLFAELIKRGAVEAMDLGITDSFGRRELMLTRLNLDFLVLCKGLPWGISTRPPLNRAVNKPDTEEASVDSEISARFLRQKSFKGFVKNPFYRREGDAWRAFGIVRTTRLDGVSFDDVKKSIQAGLNVENNGLRGRVYIDKSRKAKLGDDWLERAKNVVACLGFDMSVDEAPSVMSFGSRFDYPAVYFGWYASAPCGYFSLLNFQCADGMLGWHIYSFSGLSLARNDFWAPALISKKTSSTDGNVFEPFLHLSRHIDVFAELVFAKNVLPSEASYSSLLALSWQNIYFGDPLYNPLKYSLDSQLEDIDKGKVDTLSQYSVLRKANLLESEKGKTVAFNFISKYVGKIPDTALLWALCQRAETKEQKQKFIQLLLVREIYNDIQYTGLAFEIGATLQQLGETKKALELYEKILEKYNSPQALVRLAAMRAEQSATACNRKVSEKAQQILDEIQKEKIRKIEQELQQKRKKDKK